jgi:hypothetical protein
MDFHSNPLAAKHKSLHIIFVTNQYQQQKKFFIIKKIYNIKTINYSESLSQQSQQNTRDIVNKLRFKANQIYNISAIKLIAWVNLTIDFIVKFYEIFFPVVVTYLNFNT